MVADLEDDQGILQQNGSGKHKTDGHLMTECIELKFTLVLEGFCVNY